MLRKLSEFMATPWGIAVAVVLFIMGLLLGSPDNVIDCVPSLSGYAKGADC